MRVFKYSAKKKTSGRIVNSMRKNRFEGKFKEIIMATAQKSIPLPLINVIKGTMGSWRQDFIKNV